MKPLALVALLTTTFFQCVLAMSGSSCPQTEVTMQSTTDTSIVMLFRGGILEQTERVGQQGEVLTAFTLKGESTDMIEAGNPAVPIIERLVRVPKSGKISLRYRESKRKLLSQKKIAPYQLPLSHDGTKAPYRYNEEAFKAPLFPTEIVQLRSIERLGDIRVARLHFYPLQYATQTGEIYSIPEVEVTLAISNEKGESEIRGDKSLRKSQLPFYKDVLNMGSVRVRAEEPVPTYLFIGNDETLSQVEDLINWKKQKGLEVVVQDVSTIGSTTSQIDNVIESTYESAEGNLFVLLCGDETIVPTFSMNCPYSQVKSPSDNAYGVIGSGYNPSIYVGRITHADQTMDSYGYQAWKIVQHESNPEEGAWMTKAMTWGCSQPNGEPTTSYWQKQLQAAGLNSSQELEAYGAKKAAQLVSAFNAGLSTFSMKGHGNDQSWHSAKLGIGYGMASVASMDIGQRFCWVNNIACLNSRFQYSQYTCFAEQMMAIGSIGDAKGCLGMYSFTVSSSGGSPTTASDGMLSALYDALFVQDVRHVGMAAAYGTKTSGTSGDKKSSMIWGCPETDIYFQYPLNQFTAPVDDPIPGKPYTIATGVAGALVSLVTDSYESLASAYCDENGDVTLELPAYSSATILTMTARNTKPLILEYEKTGIISSGNKGTTDDKQLVVLQNRSGYFSLQIKGVPKGVYALRLLDNRGRILIDEQLNSIAGETTTNHSGNLSAGIYMVHITGEQYNSIQKCLIF